MWTLLSAARDWLYFRAASTFSLIHELPQTRWVTVASKPFEYRPPAFTICFGMSIYKSRSETQTYFVRSNTLVNVIDLSEADLDFRCEGGQTVTVGHLEGSEVSVT